MKQRVIETNEGIQRAPDVNMFDEFQRSMRDRGWIETNQIIKSGIDKGNVLELGPGPGYLGLEWLKHTTDTQLTGLEISANMIKLARRNANDYGFNEDRVNYVHGNVMTMPFEDNTFDAAFSNGSLHEREDPKAVFIEIHRILKKGGRFFVSDLRRDLRPHIKLFLNITTKKSMRKGLQSSINAAYTKQELESMLSDTLLSEVKVETGSFGLTITGTKK